MSYLTTVLADTPWLYWRLDDAGPTVGADASGNSRTGTYSLTPTFSQASLVVDGVSSVLFNVTDPVAVGGGSYLYSDAGVIFNSSQATVECWFNYDGVAPAAGKFWYVGGCCENDGSGTSDKIIIINELSEPAFYAYDGATKTAVATGFPLSVGTHHLVGTYNGTNLQIYIDGVSRGSLAASSTYTGYTNPNVLVGGRSNALVALSILRKAARRDEFALYTTALSSGTILAHYNAGVAITPSIAWLHA